MSLNDTLIEADKVLNKLTISTEKEIIKAYAESLKNIRGQLADIYAKFSDNDGKLSFAEMSKYNRLKVLEEQIQEQLIDLTGKNAKALKTSLNEIFTESYFRTAFAIESFTQVNLKYGLLNPKVIESSIQNPISGLTLNDRLEKNRLDIIINIKQQITQGLIQGESYPQMAKRIKDTLEGDAKKARKVVNTEAHRVQNDGRYQSGKYASEKGINMVKVWDASLSLNTRDAHRKLDGTKVDIYENFVSPTGAEGLIPGSMGKAEDDVNCRCALRYEIVGYEPSVRRARDKDGKGIIIPHKSYEEWYESKGF